MPDLGCIWVVVAAYNEDAVIGQVLRDLCTYPYHVVLVNDGSTDNTLSEAMGFPVTILQHVNNLGQGAALQTGISYILRYHQADFIVTFDGDGQHHASDIEKMVRACRDGNYDVVLGSRFVQGGHAENISSHKAFTLRMAIGFTRLITGLPLTDTHNGLRVFTRASAARIRITQNGMAHASEILNQIAELKLRYTEAPVTISYTNYSLHKGQSILNSINILWDIVVGKIR